MGKFPKFFISLDHAKFVDSSKIWIKLMHFEVDVGLGQWACIN